MRQEILAEFESYSSVDYSDNFSISEVYQFFNDPDTYVRKDDRGFKIRKRGLGYWHTERGKIKFESLKLFSRLLMEHGNLEYARREAAIGHYLAIKYMKLLNLECEERGLPLPFKIKPKIGNNCKLSAKQVGYIKYLITKYSTFQVAAMYSISQSAILLIKKGLTWKDIKPVIKEGNTIRQVNKYISTLITEEKRREVYYLPEDVLIRRIIRNRWGSDSVRCPFCKSDKHWCNELEKRYKCASPGCYKKFTPLTRTIYQGTKISLSIWYGIECFLALDNRKSSLELAGLLNVTQKTVWKIMEKLKKWPFKSLITQDFQNPINW